MIKHRRVYAREFKILAVKLVVEQGRGPAEAARGLGIRENLFQKWDAMVVIACMPSWSPAAWLAASTRLPNSCASIGSKA